MQFQTDRAVGKPLGPFVWREAPVRVLHGRTELATTVEPCVRPLAFGERGEARGGTFRIERGAVFDRVYVDNDKIAVALPPGAFHGGCLVDEKRLWIAWSTPERPADLFTITLKDGNVRRLRDEARPGLGGLADLSVVDRGGALVARARSSKNEKARGIVTLIEPSDETRVLGMFSPLVRAFAEAGFAVVRVHEGGKTEAENRAVVLANEMLAAGQIEAPSLWTARLAEAPPAVPPRTLWIDPRALERTLGQALTALSPEDTSPSAANIAAPSLPSP